MENFLKNSVLHKKEYYTEPLLIDEDAEEEVEDIAHPGEVPGQDTKFTPLLKDLYDEIQRRKAAFEVIFISFDKTKEDMEQYFVEMHGDWLALPFGDPLIEKLKSQYDISSVPKLVVVRDDGEVLTMKGRKEVQDKGIICYRNWQNLLASKSTKKSECQEETDTDKGVPPDMES
ncbi:hypothetical protein ScPMuIL_006821 [Solemya velum]